MVYDQVFRMWLLHLQRLPWRIYLACSCATGIRIWDETSENERGVYPRFRANGSTNAAIRAAGEK